MSQTPSTQTDKLIPLYLDKGIPFVWNAEGSSPLYLPLAKVFPQTKESLFAFTIIKTQSSNVQ